MKSHGMQRNLHIFVLALVPALAAALLAGLWLFGEWNFQRGMSAARQALPTARASIPSDPKYSDVLVDVSDAEGGSLWFTGMVPTDDDANYLEALVRERCRVPIIFTVLSREPINYAKKSRLDAD